MSNRKKYNNVHVWDVTFYKSDDDGNELLNEDGSIMLFTAPNVDFCSTLDHVQESDLDEGDTTLNHWRH